MTIEILEADKIDDIDLDIWACWLEITQSSEAYLLPVSAPGSLAKGALQGYFESIEDELFSKAQEKAIQTDEIYNRLIKRILKAFALVVLDEVNILRGLHSLQPRTAEQLRQAVKGKL